MRHFLGLAALAAALASTGCSGASAGNDPRHGLPGDLRDAGGGADAAIPGSGPDAAATDGAVPLGLDAAPEVAADTGPAHKRVFMTSGAYDGDLAKAGAAADGASGADALCNQAVSNAKLGGTWHAWICTFETNAVDRVTSSGPWYSLDGTEAFNVSGSLGVHYAGSGTLDVTDENGKSMSDQYAWTGCTDMGVADIAFCYGYNCNSSCVDFTTTTDAQGFYGWSTGGFYVWETLGTDKCATAHHLWCFED